MTTIDTHQHLWIPSERRYDWLDVAGLPLNADFGPELIADDAVAAEISGTILVQAADTYEDTFYMLSVAARDPTVIGVIGWAPLDRVDEARAALDLYAGSLVRGIRALNHTYSDPRWLLRAGGVELLASRGFTLDVVSTEPTHLEMIAELATRHPQLSIVIDHLGKPDIADKGWEPWASLLAAAATRPNVSVKLSGLNTASAPGWTIADWQPYVDHAVASFGADRMMMGSDWPVSILNGDFLGVWRAQCQVIADLSDEQQQDILHRAAKRIYKVETS